MSRRGHAKDALTATEPSPAVAPLATNGGTAHREGPPDPRDDPGTAAATAPWDGPALLAAVTAATDALTANRDRINALNVFPVPDGDTGTNMGLTMRAALDEAAALRGPAAARAGEVAAKVAYGALMGARGNSGVILSQIFRGFARAVADEDAIDGPALAAALVQAREMAYKAVMRPVEGTMLTVIRGAAERAAARAAVDPSLVGVIGAATEGAEAALATTPDLLDILRQAGVVDAGGQGVVHILAGMARYARGEASVPADATGTTDPAAVGAEMAFLDKVEELHGEDIFGYCTNFMVFGERIDFERSRAELAAMGESAVIVGDDTVLKVHIHVLNPGMVLDYALRLGELGQIKIDNMQAQTRALSDQRGERREQQHEQRHEQRHEAAQQTSAGRPVPAVAAASDTAAVAPLGRQAILAVAAGDGLGEALRSMGASGIIRGGQTMNPSIEELLDAVTVAEQDEVILLPNNPNIVLTANHVPELTSKRVRVVPSRSVPQGLAALAAHQSDGDLDANAAAMVAALASVRTVELTRAVRDATINGVAVRAGQAIGLLDDVLVASGDDDDAVTGAALAEAGLDDAELVTVFTGEGIAPEQAETLRATIAADHPGVEVEVYAGGQPHYRYVIAVE